MFSRNSSRRHFIKTIAAGTAGAGLALGLPTTGSARSHRRIRGANDRIRVGLIGMGRQARGHTRAFMSEADAQVVALCDVYTPNLQYAATLAPEADTYTDLRRLLDRPDVDAVVISTPDHWHALATVMACDAGKDVYVEKPTAVTIGESRKMVEAARRHDRIVQVGTQQRSDRHFQQAAQLVRDGGLGDVTFVRTWNYSNDLPAGFGHRPDGPPPPGLDWALWLGPAPRVPFNANRFGVFLDADRQFERWATWRYFWDYAGGLMTDWGVHLLDIVQWATGADYPLAVAAMGGKFHVLDNRDTPDTLQVTYQYPGFLCVYENRVCNSYPMDGQHYGIMFHGTKGTMLLNRSGFTITPEPGSSLEPMKVENTGAERSHQRDFLDAVRSRKAPICDIEIGHRSSSTAMLGNVAYRTGRRLTWDGAREAFVGDPDAARLLTAPYHGAWTL